MSDKRKAEACETCPRVLTGVVLEGKLMKGKKEALIRIERKRAVTNKRRIAKQLLLECQLP